MIKDSHNLELDSHTSKVDSESGDANKLCENEGFECSAQEEEELIDLREHNELLNNVDKLTSSLDASESGVHIIESGDADDHCQRQGSDCDAQDAERTKTDDKKRHQDEMQQMNLHNLDTKKQMEILAEEKAVLEKSIAQMKENASLEKYGMDQDSWSEAAHQEKVDGETIENDEALDKSNLGDEEVSRDSPVLEVTNRWLTLTPTLITGVSCATYWLYQSISYDTLGSDEP